MLIAIKRRKPGIAHIQYYVIEPKKRLPVHFLIEGAPPTNSFNRLSIQLLTMAILCIVDLAQKCVSNQFISIRALKCSVADIQLAL